MAANSAGSSGIWLEYKLIQAFMVLLVPCEIEEEMHAYNFFHITSLREFIQMHKASYFCSMWSNQAKFQTHSRFYSCPPFLQNMKMILSKIKALEC